MTQRRDQINPDLSTPQLSQGWHFSQMLTWRTYLLVAMVLFVVFYWGIPSWLNYELGTFQKSTARPIASALLTRRIEWIQLFGIALSSVCIFMAVRNYFSLPRTSKSYGNHLEFFNRLFARLIN